LAPFWQSSGVTHGGSDTVTNYWQVVFGNVKGHKDWITYPDYLGIGADYTVVQSVSDGTLPAGTDSSDLEVSIVFNSGTGKNLVFLIYSQLSAGTDEG